MLSEGEKAPSFELVADDETSLKLSALKGSILVLYFYPKDDTSGCTKQAVEFTAKVGEFARYGARIIGISPDSVKKHQKFIAKHDLGITLLADDDKSVCDAYGVWVEKSMYGRKYMGVERSTFLIDNKGRIVKIWRKVKVPGHVDEVLEEVRVLSEA